MIHAGIDGYSRLITYMKCATNNRAGTVYVQFLQAIEEYGLPLRVRSDQGRENVRVAEHMIEYRGANRGSMLVGSSVHNQRIERLWRDMHRCMTSVYYRLFYFMEQNRLLNPLNERHLFALHYVYLPRINQSLDTFRDGWNNHSLRSEHNQTPLQLFTAGMLEYMNSGLDEMKGFEMAYYGVEEAGIVPSQSEDSEGVQIPPVSFPLSDAQLTTLRNTVNPLTDSDSYGIDLYQLTLTLI